MTERLAIGLDLGGTDLKSGLVARDGSLAAFARRPSGAQAGADAPIEAMVEAVAALEREAGTRAPAIGLGTPGTVDPASGALVGRTPHLPHWDGTPLRSLLEARLGRPVVVDNDANCAALAEHRCGVARGSKVTLMVTLGTGVGGAVVVDGRVLHGAFGGAGELGHVALGSGELTCRCGVERCAEPEMSASGLVRAAKKAGIDAADGLAVFAAAARSDERAVALVDRMGDRLGAAIAAAVGILNPDLVVVGGGMAQAGEPLLSRVRRAVERYALPSHRRGLRIEPARLGERAGVVGAGLMAQAM
jgi:glucokinase